MRLLLATVLAAGAVWPVSSQPIINGAVLVGKDGRILDLGPEGGDQGGKIIATGTPEQVARNTQSHTGRFLARVLNGNGQARLADGQAKRPANGASKPAGPSATISNGAKIPAAEP